MNNLKANGHVIECDFELSASTWIDGYKECIGFHSIALLLSDIKGSILYDYFSNGEHLEISVNEGDITYTFIGAIVYYEDDSIKGCSATIQPCGMIAYE